jgi:hypothetical protein
MYSGEYDACDVTLSVYPHRASSKNMPDHGGNRTYDLWNTSPEYITPTQKKIMIILIYQNRNSMYKRMKYSIHVLYFKKCKLSFNFNL